MFVEMFTDGACSGNPGPGGWCCILRYGKYERLICGGDAQTTNNRMELIAVIEGLRALNRPCEVLITTDSKYVSDSVMKDWVLNWEKKNWIRSGKPVPNADLWQTYLQLASQHQIAYKWVRGHNGHPENERCDKEAVLQIEKYRSKA